MGYLPGCGRSGRIRGPTTSPVWRGVLRPISLGDVTPLCAEGERVDFSAQQMLDVGSIQGRAHGGGSQRASGKHPSASDRSIAIRVTPFARRGETSCKACEPQRRLTMAGRVG